MSFTAEIKEEILAQTLHSSEERRAFLAAAVRGMGTLHNSSLWKGAEIESDNAGMLFTLCEMAKETLRAETELETRTGGDGTVTMRIKGMDAVEKLGLLSDGAGVPLDKAQYVKAYTGGFFAAAGSCSVPTDGSSSYHFEIALNDDAIERELANALSRCGIAVKSFERNGASGIYAKDSDVICDLLAFMGAKQAVMELNNIIAVRSVNNNINRQSNCAAANIDKSFDASSRQLLAIRRLEEEIGLDRLPDKLSEIAKLRLANPELSLGQLSELTGGRISKSSVNRRLRKLADMAAEYERTEDGGQ